REHLAFGELHARGPRGIREIAAAAQRGLLARLIAAGRNRHPHGAPARDGELLGVLERRGELFVVAALQEGGAVEEPRRGDGGEDAENHEHDDELYQSESRLL